MSYRRNRAFEASQIRRETTLQSCCWGTSLAGGAIGNRLRSIETDPRSVGLAAFGVRHSRRKEASLTDDSQSRRPFSKPIPARGGLPADLLRRVRRDRRTRQNHVGGQRTQIRPLGDRVRRPNSTRFRQEPAPVLKVRAGETLKVQWSFTNIYPHKTLEDALLYFYVAPIAKVGQKETPDLSGEKAIVEAGFEMDLKPNRKAGQRQTLRIDTPGVYLVRIESRRTQSDHEHFAAIDLVVEPAPKGE